MCSSDLGNQQKSELVQFEDVVDFLAQRSIASIDLMKINIEGGEYELLKRMIDGNLIAKVRHLQIQFHDIGPWCEQTVANIRSALQKTHRADYCYEFVWESWTLKESVTA